MMTRESISLGQWTIDGLNELLHKAASINSAGERIAFLSARFLGIPYLEDTLVGSADTDEVFVINFAGVDCFTFIDYMEAMRLSSSFCDFKECLKRIRYRGGSTSFRNRKHFFTDWLEFNGEFVQDATGEVGLQGTRTAHKVLNGREDGTLFVPGIQPVNRDIKFIPSSLVYDKVVGSLKTGDYIGIYSDVAGLDVSHVGIFIRHGDGTMLRHASSKQENRKVVDQDFAEYVKHKPGIIVLRPMKRQTVRG